MPQAVCNGAVLAESDDTVVVEGNHFFPATSLRRRYFRGSDTTTVCGWKETARCDTLEVDGRTNPDAAWRHDEPKPAAEDVRGRFAFCNGVQIR